MKVIDFDQQLDKVDPTIRSKVVKVLRSLYEDSRDFDELTAILQTVQVFVKEQIKKADTKKFK